MNSTQTQKIESMVEMVQLDWWAVVWGMILGSIVSYMAPVAPFIALSVLLIVADWYLGVKAARKRKEEINSQGFARTIEKIAVYLLMILCAQGVKVVFFDNFHDTYFPFVGDFPITYITAFAICVREFKSIAENAYDITGVDFWYIIADRIETIFNLLSNNKKDDENQNEP